MNLYTTTKDEAGSSKHVDMRDKTIKTIEDQITVYKNALNKGGSVDDSNNTNTKTNSIGTK